MSAVEGAVSVVGQALACELIALRLWNLAVAALPAIRLTVLCALATLAGRTLAKIAMPDGIGSNHTVVLLAAALPAALIYLWIERSHAADLIGKAFVPGGGVRTKASQAQA